MATARKLAHLEFLEVVFLSSSSDDDDSEDEILLSLAIRPSDETPKVRDFVGEIVKLYTDIDFRKHFRVPRNVCDSLIADYESSQFYPKAERGRRPEKTPEEHVLSFLW
ncbi:hypothetical protein HPB52_006501 [Rhipicephalus sanguineus]|uniref:Uncharacterized protein n=1 Tax=Rhipicephalus sanguineus TaxID=34632 RepID=A0A9D4T8R0_RHISA|nr:hypothetical protein HPB52_006501 [Rhipicephalus sanguineus]